MSEIEANRYWINCHRCNKCIEEQVRVGVRMLSSLKALCERRAYESGWKEVWVCSECKNNESRAGSTIPYPLKVAFTLSALLFASLVLFIGARAIRTEAAEAEREWNTFVEKRVVALPQDHKKALRWLATNWTVSGDEWRKEFPEVDACILSEKTGVMECNSRTDHWVMARYSRKAVLKATEGCD